MRISSRATRISIAALLAALAAGPVASQSQSSSAKNLTVERIFSEPSLSGNLTEGIEWAPDGKRFSYLAADAGTTVEIWTMDAAAGERKVLVNAETLKSVAQPEKEKAIQATGLGRVEAQNYQWSPDGQSLLFVGSNSLVLLGLATGKWKPLVSSQDEISDPKFSPDSKWVSFVRGANLWVANTASGGEARPLTTGGSEEVLKGQLDWVYPEELDCRTAYWWSPDSSKIAYYQMDERPVTRYPLMDMSSPVGAMQYTRYPQAGEANPIVRVGVVRVAGGEAKESSGPASVTPETRWMDTGSNTDVYMPRVDWLRDSQHVAIQRLNRAQNRLDLLFADAVTGASRMILTQTDKYWININDDLYFFADGKRFLWSSEQTGFRHYYIYDLSGKQVEQLTSGDWGITGTGGVGPGAAGHPAVDEKRGYVYFTSNKDDVIENQVYRVSLRDKSITQITHGAGTHDVSIAPDASAFVDTFSTAMTPPRQDLYRTDGTRVAVINENKVAELAEYRLSPVEFLTVSADDGTKLYAEIIKPPDFNAAKKYPVLISAYGGPQVQAVRNAWGAPLWDEMMAEKGYIVFSLDNRGSYNRGRAFEAPIYHHFGKIELEDQLSGVKYLESLPYVDGSRIGIWGWSFGGFMTLYALANAPEVFKAGVSVAPVSDWRLYDTIYTERYMGRPQDNSEGYGHSSPVNQAVNLKAKLMMAHGTGDDNVHFANTSEMLNELIASGRYATELMIFPGRGHPIGDHAATVLLFERIAQFVSDNL
jgi:dipeptidyl-peptidase-4